MQTYPIFLKLAGRRVVFSGAGDHAAAKIKLLLKTEARIAVYGTAPCDDVLRWAAEGRIAYADRAIADGDTLCARLVYGANDDAVEDARAVALGRQAGALTNIVDNLEASEFLTPAIVDRDPVVVAIGTEGTAPVLARRIKAGVEEMLPASTGPLARIANTFRSKAARLSRIIEASCVLGTVLLRYRTEGDCRWWRKGRLARAGKPVRYRAGRRRDHGFRRPHRHRAG